MEPPVTVVGAGLAGAACAVALATAGVAVRVLDRGGAPGGRLASPELHGRWVDVGAAYFTARDEEFITVVDRWRALGLAREWTDTFAVVGLAEDPTASTGPMRYATPGGLRSLVRELLDGAGLTASTGTDVDRLPDGPVVLAMPDPQSQRVWTAPELRYVDYDPVIAVVCGFARRDWDFRDAAFVHDHPDVTFVADDGARRGDGAPVLVAHTTGERARAHLESPDDVVTPVVAALQELVGAGTPEWTATHRWTFAKPTSQHDATFYLHTPPTSGPIGLAGDQWCPHGSPRVESAWRSGTDLGRALAAQLA